MIRSVKLLQIPFSHNCIKVRVALALKGLPYEIENIRPMDRSEVFRVSGQGLVPVLVDGGRAVADSTAILLYLDEKQPEPALLPRDPRERNLCLVLEDWADRAFMEASRRIAYHRLTGTPGLVGSLFFPKDRGLKAHLKERIAVRRLQKRFRFSPERYPRDAAEVRRAAALAMERLEGKEWLVGERPTVADIALATMSAPLAVDPAMKADSTVAALLQWGERLLPPDVVERYRSAPAA
jgi:glutathione S-transferase